MERLVEFVLSNFTLTVIVGWLICVSIAIASSSDRSRPTVIKKLFSHYLLIVIGIGYIYNFVVHVFFADMTAAFIGWANSPFQIEVGVVSLGMGIAGVIAFRAGLGFRAATIIPPVVFSWGAAIGHVYQMISAHNFAPGNAGVIFWTDIFIPVIGLVLLWLQYTTSKNHTTFLAG